MSTVTTTPADAVAPGAGASRPRRALRATRQDERYRRGIGRWFVLAAAVLVALLMLSPFVIMVLNAFKSPAEYSQDGPLSIPSEL